MKTHNAKKTLEKTIQAAGTAIDDLTVAQGVRFMLDFYRDVRADGCNPAGDGDMLLFQYGTWDFGDGETFQFDITRQFMLDDNQDDDSITQLSFSFHFKPFGPLTALKSAEHWCNTPGELHDFEKIVMGSAAYQAVYALKPTKVTLNDEGV